MSEDLSRRSRRPWHKPRADLWRWQAVVRSEPDSNKTRRICKTPRADPAWLALLFDSTPPSAARSEAAVQSLIILRTERLSAVHVQAHEQK